MSTLIALLQRYAYLFAFVILEIVSFILIINYNQKQRDIFLHSSNLWSGSLLKKSTQISDFLNLKKSNDDLLKENAKLLQEIVNLPPSATLVEVDTSIIKYELIPALVINNSILSTRNRITIDKGRVDGIRPSMGIITNDGIVGIIYSVSDHYSTGLSVLNIDIRLSASISDQNFFGTILWKGQGFDQLFLDGIPKHAQVRKGAQIETNGYSSVFPPGIKVGTVTDFKLDNDGLFYEINVKPSIDYSSLSYIYILKSINVIERTTLENE